MPRPLPVIGMPGMPPIAMPQVPAIGQLQPNMWMEMKPELDEVHTRGNDTDTAATVETCPPAMTLRAPLMQMEEGEENREPGQTAQNTCQSQFLQSCEEDMAVSQEERSVEQIFVDDQSGSLVEVSKSPNKHAPPSDSLGELNAVISSTQSAQHSEGMTLTLPPR